MGLFGSRKPAQRARSNRSTEFLFSYSAPFGQQRALDSITGALKEIPAFHGLSFTDSSAGTPGVVKVWVDGKYLHVLGGTYWRAMFRVLPVAPNHQYFPHGIDGDLRLDCNKSEVRGMRDEAKILANECSAILRYKYGFNVQTPSPFDNWEI